MPPNAGAFDTYGPSFACWRRCARPLLTAVNLVHDGLSGGALWARASSMFHARIVATVTRSGARFSLLSKTKLFTSGCTHSKARRSCPIGRFGFLSCRMAITRVSQAFALHGFGLVCWLQLLPRAADMVQPDSTNAAQSRIYH